ncbi:dephospho-CoA kinase [Roseovarius sp. LXJ103]|uniref:dephospho-CoA kinase n=1 Tax=Roseovarius carneus TaxID=2853164 RepID=UPI000D605196|nr:dephospho-CoA kinase [Roseovarius carneus]MBZ8117924.1 dephospho-CoA kinase [Roseovarius carneus]PWE36322.1 dephospho-CoA kinase [Pelagicola sp. LXJ1103]
MTFRLGLTGSIGMGKSTTAKLFAEAGCPVWDADAAVHRLYGVGGAAVAPMQAAFPDTVHDGAVSRDALKAILAETPEALAQIERIVHPLVAQDRAQFLRGTDADIVVLDIPLLYETRGEKHMNAVVVVTAPAEIQRARVLERGTMTEAQLDAILAKQMPDSEKRALADYVITTDTVEHARAQVQDILATIRAGQHA